LEPKMGALDRFGNPTGEVDDVLDD
jgi:hypothetical protein